MRLSALNWLVSGFVLLSLPATAATVDVTNYGAVPDDGGDDRAAIQSAIAAASDGDVVYFPGGTYRVSGAIMAKSGIRLEGTNTNGSVLLYVGGALSEMIAIGSVANVVVSHLTLDGNGSTAVKDGILAWNGSGHRLQNLTIRNIGNASEGPRGIRFDTDVTDSIIVSNRIENIGTGSAWGAGVRLSWRSSRNQVTDNVISNTGRGGIFCDNDSTDNVILRNVVAGSGGDGLGIELWGRCHRGLIEDNRIDHWLSLDSSDFCAVRRNTVSDKSGIYKWAGLEGISQNSVFTDNVVDGGAQVGISQSNWPTKEYMLWARNTIKGCAMFGLFLGGVDGPCQYQYFYQNRFLSSIGTQPPAQYSGAGDGIRFDQNCYYITFETNEVSYNYHDGIWPMWSSANLNYFSFTGNTIQNNGNGGAWDGYGTDLEWVGNIISGNHGGGALWNAQLTSRGFANQKPVAAFTAPLVAQPGQVVSFANTSSDPDGSIGHVLWDFGNGLPSTTSSPSFTYTQAGTYVVTLIVWDNLGRGARAEQTIHVISYPPGDVNGDLHVTGADALLINQVIVGLRSNTHPIFATTGFANGDVDQTSTVTGGDSLLINQVQVGLRSYVVTKIVPNSRTNNVPTAVTIYGVGFPTGTVSGVTIGSPVSLTLSNVTVFSREQINAIVPAGGGSGTGTVNVVATPTNSVISFGRFITQ